MQESIWTCYRDEKRYDKRIILSTIIVSLKINGWLDSNNSFCPICKHYMIPSDFRSNSLKFYNIIFRFYSSQNEVF